MERTLLIRKLKAAANLAAADVCALMDANDIEKHPIDNVNWPEAYPYKPEVSMRIAHTGDRILVHYHVCEATVRAVAEQDNGRVWEDSCCEFFVSPEPSDNIYYNLETNCAGRLLIGSGCERHNRQCADTATLSGVSRWSSLGNSVFEEKEAPAEWDMAIIIPASTFFHHRIEDFSGVQMRANFYKCGDKLQTPHFLSWSPITTENPDFHRPEFFGLIDFE